MSVLVSRIKPGQKSSADPGLHGGSWITVKCPKCQADIRLSGFKGDAPIRCGKCAYPMIRRSDLLQIVAACRNVSTNDQIGSAVGILKQLTKDIPEAGTALGALARKHTVPFSDQQRWELLIAACAGGDENAREWLDKMCESRPDAYKCGHCANCGAPKYYLRGKKGETQCNYCQSMD